MFLEVERKQFEIQQLKENLVSCVFRPKNRFLPKEYEIIVKKGQRFYELIQIVKCDDCCNWWTLCTLANLCKDYDGNYLT